MLPIDKNVPTPPQHPRASAKYPWRALEVGDSFLSPGAKQGPLSAQASIAGAKLGRKFVTAKVEGGVRVWRVE